MSPPDPSPRRDPVTVAVDTAPLLGPMTGVGAAVEQLLAAFAGHDHVEAVTYACSFRGHLPPSTTRLPIPAALAYRLWARAAWPKFDRWLRPAQVVHGTNYVVGPSRLPRVVSVYDCWFLRHPEQASATVNRAGRVLRRAVATGATVHVSSHATAHAARELLSTDRVEVIPLAALPKREAAPGSPLPIAELTGTPYVLALGTIERRKNLAHLVTAFGHLATVDTDTRLVLAGSDGDDRDSVDAAIDDLSPSARARVVLTGRIDDQAKAALLGAATVLAYPSLDEGFGFPLLEAMQHRVPVVASTSGSIPEVAGDAAILVPADDVAALAAALESTLTDSAIRAQLVAAGARRLATYSWQATADAFADLYTRLAHAGPA